jgi:hypothetical protein
MTPVVLSERVQHLLRDPPLDEATFRPTGFTPASTKTWFGRHMLHFLASGFPEHQFTQRFYGQLMHCFGFCACYDRAGFWTEHFASTRGRAAFVEQIAGHPGWGSPERTFCDVEREVSRRVRASKLHLHLLNHLCEEQEATDRAEFARLAAKYANPAAAEATAAPVRTVYVPITAPPAARAHRRDGDVGQLAFGLG